MEKKTYATLSDLRKEWEEINVAQHLGEMRRLFLTKDGRLEIETDFGFVLRIYFAKDDLYRLLNRLIEIRKIELEQKAKRRAKVEAKAAKQEVNTVRGEGAS